MCQLAFPTFAKGASRREAAKRRYLAADSVSERLEPTQNLRINEKTPAEGPPGLDDENVS
jgi:hypothetical protein